MRRQLLPILATVLLLGADSAAAKDGAWLNVHVRARRERTDVTLHLPMPLVSAIVSAIDLDGHHGRVTIRHSHLDCDARVWGAAIAELRRARDGETVKVRNDDEQVTFRRNGDQVEIEAESDHEHVTMRVAAELIDTLADDEFRVIDLETLLRSIGRAGVGELLVATSDDAEVRIWVE
jgi:hypothetical protein